MNRIGWMKYTPKCRQWHSQALKKLEERAWTRAAVCVVALFVMGAIGFAIGHFDGTSKGELTPYMVATLAILIFGVMSFGAMFGIEEADKALKTEVEAPEAHEQPVAGPQS